jgi:hypothetical protein
LPGLAESSCRDRARREAYSGSRLTARGRACGFGNLLTTRNREQFVGHIGEVLVADDPIRRDLDFGIPVAPGSSRQAVARQLC